MPTRQLSERHWMLVRLCLAARGRALRLDGDARAFRLARPRFGLGLGRVHGSAVNRSTMALPARPPASLLADGAQRRTRTRSGHLTLDLRGGRAFALAMKHRAGCAFVPCPLLGLVPNHGRARCAHNPKRSSQMKQPSTRDAAEARLISHLSHFPPDDADVDGDAWIEVLRHLQELHFEIVVPGHGHVGDAGLITTARAYHERLRDETFRLADEGLDADDAVAQLEPDVLSRHPDWEEPE
jgi:hypothetical protein